MSHRYAPLHNPRSGSQSQLEQENEMAAAFDYSEDEDDELDTSENRPLNSQSSSNTTRDTPARILQSSPPTAPHTPGTYDFENIDYDYPPPGSPPQPSMRALPNDYGNTNGLVPHLDSIKPPRQSWFRRTAAAALPSKLAGSLGLAPQRPSGPVGGGTVNDGVFANVTAKPSAPVVIQDGDSTYVVPEVSGNEAPPSYASAQADAVPPYWETTVHAPFSPDSAGEMIIDALPTGSVFSFLWNMLVSVSFQFVGFLLTYLLHTTHAARLGSRAGLGITLIQYGFALRGKIDAIGDGEGWNAWRDPAQPTPGAGANDNPILPAGPMPDDQTNAFAVDATTEWLSFFLMTVGWFMLLTSLLGFWRVKRWERGILASQRESNVTPRPTQAAELAVVSRLEQMFRLPPGSRVELFRHGFGFGGRQDQDEDGVRAVIRAEEGVARELQETEPATPPLQPRHAEHNRGSSLVQTHEGRLQNELRSTGLL